MVLNLKKTIIIWYYLFFITYCSCQMYCKDENNKKVDWFILYKLPKISSEVKSEFVKEGEGYAYISSQNAREWKLSAKSILSDQSMLGQTWKQLKKKEKTATYLFYNDEPPKGFKGSASGHLKGFFAFDDRSGYWIMHTIPKFGVIKQYEYPKNALTNGQCAICVNFKVSELNKICKHLLFANPKIHLKQLSKKMRSKLNENSKSLFGKKPNFVRSGKLTNKDKLKSAGGQVFVNFAKSSKCNEDLYGEIIAPGIKSSLWVETWRRGAGTKEKKACKSKYTVNDIIAINMTVSVRRKKKSIYFKSTEDHSKWAISVEPKKNWICMTDMNRMVSQQKRGGGALCFQSSKVWNAFNGIIAKTGDCAI